MRQVIVKMTIDRQPPGTDVTGHYKPDVEARLISEGYLEVVEPEPEAEETDNEPRGN